MVRTDLKEADRRKDSLLFVHVVVKTLKLVICRCCFDEYGRERYKMRAARAARFFSCFNR